jgi:hypothetical protein
MEGPSTIKPNAIRSSKTLVNSNLITWHHLPVTLFEPPHYCVSDNCSELLFTNNQRNGINRDEQNNEILQLILTETAGGILVSPILTRGPG